MVSYEAAIHVIIRQQVMKGTLYSIQCHIRQIHVIESCDTSHRGIHSMYQEVSMLKAPTYIWRRNNSPANP